MPMLCNAFMQPSRGDYTFRVQVHSYTNPTNHCAGSTCRDRNGDLCCDISFNVFNTNCGGNERCDNVFLFCVRPLGTADPMLRTLEDTISNNRARELQCMQPPSALRSSEANDGRSINFGMPTFLGIPNPMGFQVTASMWEVSRVILTYMQVKTCCDLIGILGYSVLS